MRKMMLIDVSWINNEIEMANKRMQENMGNDNRVFSLSNYIQTLSLVKEQLESPVEMIREAFEYGEGYGAWKEDIYYSRDYKQEYPNLETYLKRKGYAE